MRKRAGILAVMFVAACGGSSATAPGLEKPTPEAETGAVAPSTAAPTMRQLKAEEEVTTSAKVVLAVPASWWVSSDPSLLLLEDPERELKLWVLTVEAKDRDAALAAGWQQAQPGFDLPVAQAVDAPPQDGWDAISQVVYVTKTEQQRAVVGIARRKGTLWHLVLVDGKTAALQRRGAQLGALVEDMKVPGVDKESFAGKTPVLDRERLGQWDAFVEEARVAAGVPGAAVVVVQGGKIVLEKGHGVRALGKKPPVTPKTAFLIGSITKSLTTVMMARLVDAQKLAWDMPITKVLPSFALADADVTSKVTIQHTVCACTGMPRRDLEMLFESDGWDPEERIASMKTFAPTTGFGETFQYSNLMVSTGGYAAGHAYAPKKKLGPAYDQAMADLVFKPLGMKATTFDFAKASKGDHALPHGQTFSLEYVAIPLKVEKILLAVRPAGGAWSSAHDMAQWVMLELAKGKDAKGKQLVSEENLMKRREPQVKITGDLSYGLGLFVQNDHGVQVIHHGGNTIGFTADAFWLPEHDIGVVVLTNAGGANAFRSAVRRRFLEIAFSGVEHAGAELESDLANQAKVTGEERALIHEADAAWIDPLLGTYKDPDLGTITLKRVKDRIVFDAGEWQTDMGKKIDRDGSIKLVTITPPFVGFELIPTEKGLVIDAGQQVYTFVKEQN